jgi:hypothetical protein
MQMISTEVERISEVPAGTPISILQPLKWFPQIGRKYSGGNALPFVDVAVVWTGFVATWWCRFERGNLPISKQVGFSREAGFLVLFSILMVLILNALGLYKQPEKKRLQEEFWLVAKAVVAASAILLFAMYLVGIVSIPLRHLLLTAGVSAGVLVLWRLFLRSQGFGFRGCGRGEQVTAPPMPILEPRPAALNTTSYRATIVLSPEYSTTLSGLPVTALPVP